MNPGGPRRCPTAADWNPLLGLGEDIEDRLAQLGQRCVLGLFEGIEVLAISWADAAPLCWSISLGIKGP